VFQDSAGMKLPPPAKKTIGIAGANRKEVRQRKRTYLLSKSCPLSSSPLSPPSVKKAPALRADNAFALVRGDEADIVSICVKVPGHSEPGC
jgi:hypothetical protein